MTEHLIKVFGERNTGTRAALTMLRNVPGVVIGGGYIPDPALGDHAEALRQSIDAKFKAPWKGLYLDAVRDMECLWRGNLGAWKHSCAFFDPGFAEKSVKVLFMVRDPYSWSLSLFRKPYHRKGPRADTLEAFVDQPWMTERRDYLPCVLQSPIVLWNEKLRSYLKFQKQAADAGVQTHVLRFEDFIADPVEEISSALSAFEIPAQGVEPVQNSTKNSAQQLSVLQDYYRLERWLGYINRAAAERIAEHVDWDLAAEFGYQAREVSDFPILAQESDPQGDPKGVRIDISKSDLIHREHGLHARLKGLSKGFRNLRISSSQS